MSVEDELLAQARQQAAAEGVSVSVVINRALRLGFANQKRPAVREQTMVYHPGTPPIDAASMQQRLAIVADDDLAQQAGLLPPSDR